MRKFFRVADDVQPRDPVAGKFELQRGDEGAIQSDQQARSAIEPLPAKSQFALRTHLLGNVHGHLGNPPGIRDRDHG